MFMDLQGIAAKAFTNILISITTANYSVNYQYSFSSTQVRSLLVETETNGFPNPKI